MGRISRALHRKFGRTAADLGAPVRGRAGRPDMPGIERFIEQGLDPIHAAYAFVQHITSHFSEGVSQFPEMRRFARIVIEAEDAYLPSGPPLSPLTTSYFTCWALFDLEFEGTDTLAGCYIEVGEEMGLSPDQLDALRKLAGSRMGVYEQVGRRGGHVRLAELITGDEFDCHCPSGHLGKKGELWYVRLLPPLLPEVANYHIAFTTPYVLVRATKGEWTQFLQRSILGSDGSDRRQALHRLLKHGPDPNFWNEFVLRGYLGHRHESILLAGIPDLEATLPHA